MHAEADVRTHAATAEAEACARMAAQRLAQAEAEARNRAVAEAQANAEAQTRATAAGTSSSTHGTPRGIGGRGYNPSLLSSPGNPLAASPSADTTPSRFSKAQVLREYAAARGSSESPMVAAQSMRRQLGTPVGRNGPW